MATTKGQVAVALMPEEDRETLICFYQPIREDRWTTPPEAPIRCTFDELPEREFSSGFGGVDGEPVICFGRHYVYVKCQYDGSEWVEAIPRTPDAAASWKGDLPVLGGG